MKHLLVYGCDNKYDTTPIKLLFQRFPISDDRIAITLESYKDALSQGILTVLHYVVQEVDSTTGSINIVTNEIGTHAPMVRKVINPEALAKTKAKPSPTAIFFAELDPSESEA